MSLSFTEENGYLRPYQGSLPLVSEDPWKEARDWCRELLVQDKECIVVGLGAGFHIIELLRAKSLDKVYVIDDRPGLVNVFRKQFPEDQARVEVIIVEDEKALLAHEIMEEATSCFLSAFAFTPCWPKGNKTFQNMHRHLAGRSPEALRIFMNKNGLRRDIRIMDEGGRRYLSIKDIELLIQEEIPPHLKINCFRILKELIL